MNNREVLIKKIQRIKDRNRVRYNLISLNDDYQPFLADENFKIEGIVRSVLNYTN